ncbi:MAG: hypothetical protein HUU01_18305 [Saprospiraceae bacterium]|nr:hypothetical protein [Saprospiraceae bacterium]
MKYAMVILLFLFCTGILFGQNETALVEGTVSYVSSQNVYVKFTATEGINKGDTLYSGNNNERLQPCLVVKDKSSTSCVCSSLLSRKIKVGEVFSARVPVKKIQEKEESPVVPPLVDTLAKASSEPILSDPEKETGTGDYKEKIRGRVSAASYSNLYGSEATHRMRYAFTLQGNNIGNSRFSMDSYITFRHTLGEWEEVTTNFQDALKVYSFAVKYDLDKKSSITVGRKINQRISSMGAIDGIQAEKGFGNLLVGAIAGSRPDFQDYGLNLNLFQVGAYVGHNTNKDNKMVQTTFAFIEQKNQAKTDRRFLYFQHTNSLVKDLNVFGSLELDLYQNIHDTVSNSLSLTNLYLSLRYKLSKRINVSASYDNRKNIIYYESFKSYIDQLIDDETRQGLRLNVNYRPFKTITWGVNASWRFQKSEANSSKNLNTYLNFSRIPWIKASASITANLLQTNYLDSKIFGVRITKELIPGKLTSDLYFRMVDYKYNTYEYAIQQQIAGLDLSVNLTRKLAFYVYYEGTFDNKTDTLHRFNTKIIQRF